MFCFPPESLSRLPISMALLARWGARVVHLVTASSTSPDPHGLCVLSCSAYLPLPHRQGEDLSSHLILALPLPVPGPGLVFCPQHYCLLPSDSGYLPNSPLTFAALFPAQLLLAPLPQLCC